MVNSVFNWPSGDVRLVGVAVLDLVLKELQARLLGGWGAVLVAFQQHLVSSDLPLVASTLGAGRRDFHLKKKNIKFLSNLEFLPQHKPRPTILKQIKNP